MSLSAALTVLARAEAAEHFMHADVDAFGAPGECHDLVARGEDDRFAEAKSKAEQLAGLPYKELRERAKVLGNITPCSGDPKWQSFVSRVYTKSYPF